MAKRFEQALNQEDTWMANKHEETLKSLFVSKMQIKTTMRFHFTSTRTAKIKKTDNSKC